MMTQTSKIDVHDLPELGTHWISTAVPADRGPQLQGHTFPGQILKTTAVATVPRFAVSSRTFRMC
jgi:hypothetical protein